MKKLPSFTILELVVAMVIGSIVISIALSSYLFFTKQFNIFFIKNEESNNISHFNKTLSSDFFYSEYLYKTSNGFDAVLKNKNISYLLLDDVIVRLDSLNRDTLMIKDVSIETKSFNDTINNKILINEVLIQGAYNNKNVLLHHYKEYNPDLLINSRLY